MPLDAFYTVYKHSTKRISHRWDFFITLKEICLNLWQKCFINGVVVI